MKMMKSMMTLTAAAAIMLAAGNAHAQYSQYGAVENFYQANVDIDNGQYVGRAVNPGYWLVDWNQWPDVDSRWTNGGFVRLGISSWESSNPSGGGIPLKDWALAYARAIGADVVIYAVHASTDKYDWTSHDVAFYARAHAQRPTAVSRPTSAQASVAMDRLQDALGKPTSKVVSGMIALLTPTIGSGQNLDAKCRNQPASSWMRWGLTSKTFHFFNM
jgi:hypothetical protein